MNSDSPFSECHLCYKIRTLLHIALSRYKRIRDDVALHRVGVHNHVSHLYLLNEEKDLKLWYQHPRSLDRKLDHIVAKLLIATQKVGVNLNSDMHDDVCTIMKQKNDEIVRLYPEGSFQRLFWSQQLDASRVMKASSMKWHPLICVTRLVVRIRHLKKAVV